MQSKSTFLEFLRGIHRYKFGPPPQKFFRGEIIQGKWRNFHRARTLFLTGVEIHVLPCVLVCFLVEFDLLFAFSVLPLDCASLFIYRFTNTIANAFRCQPRKQLYLIAFVDLQYRSKVSYHPLARRESRLSRRESRLKRRYSRLASELKNWKYRCLNFSWDFSSLLLTVQQQRSKT